MYWDSKGTTSKLQQLLKATLFKPEIAESHLNLYVTLYTLRALNGALSFTLIDITEL